MVNELIFGKAGRNCHVACSGYMGKFLGNSPRWNCFFEKFFQSPLISEKKLHHKFLTEFQILLPETATGGVL